MTVVNIIWKTSPIWNFSLDERAESAASLHEKSPMSSWKIYCGNTPHGFQHFLAVPLIFSFNSIFPPLFDLEAGGTSPGWSGALPPFRGGFQLHAKIKAEGDFVIIYFFTSLSIGEMKMWIPASWMLMTLMVFLTCLSLSYSSSSRPSLEHLSRQVLIPVTFFFFNSSKPPLT